VNVKLPPTIGLPEIVPAVERVSPIGRLPSNTENLYGAVPPLAVMV
jgi:hypothetical protein